jgi:GxxExxY protein
MHPLFLKADKLSHVAIGAAIEVHKLKGPGLLESIYERCLVHELLLRQATSVNQRIIQIDYKGLVFEEILRCDVLVENCLLLELKCVEKILPIHKAQLLSYMRLLDVPIGLIINFHELKLVDGIVRMILPGANQ